MIVALDMLDDPEYTRPYLQRLAAQILSPVWRLMGAIDGKKVAR